MLTRPAQDPAAPADQRAMPRLASPPAHPSPRARAAALATVLLAACLPSAAAAAEPLGGVAVAECHGNGTRIVRLGLDGTERPLTVPAERAGRPKLSYDGRKVVYQAATTAGGSEIWIMNSDGTGKGQVTRLGGHATHPAISPDHSRVLFPTAPGPRTRRRSTRSASGAEFPPA
jgi:hypothetical protein